MKDAVLCLSPAALAMVFTDVSLSLCLLPRVLNLSPSLFPPSFTFSPKRLLSLPQPPSPPPPPFVFYISQVKISD